jgi:hypothetical protein
LTHGFKAEKMPNKCDLQGRLRMLDDQSDAEATGRSKLTAVGPDRDLLTLEAELEDLIAQLHAAQRESGVPSASADLVAAVSKNAGGDPEGASVSGAQTEHVEAILARLYPIERAIMAAPAYSIIGLGVKARHAAYVMSEYWDEPTNKIDWEAKTIRLLIEAVCEVARKPLPFRTRGS